MVGFYPVKFPGTSVGKPGGDLLLSDSAILCQLPFYVGTGIRIVLVLLKPRF